MNVDFHPLRLAEHLHLLALSADRFHLVHAGSRGAQLGVPAGWITLWLPLQGPMHFESPHGHWGLPRGHLLVARESLQGGSRSAASWLMLAGSQANWDAALAQVAFARTADLFARQWPCPRPLQRSLVHLARQARDGRGHEGAALRALCADLLDSQRQLEPLIERCNGRTAQRRKHTFQRLLRVHQLIERDGDGRLDLAQLARSASYSPWHLIRLYRAVFGETPSEHAHRLRLARAWALVCESDLPVCAITEQLGFESQSAFCRAFKNAYGLTTTQVRLLPPSAWHSSGLRAAHTRPRSRQRPALRVRR